MDQKNNYLLDTNVLLWWLHKHERLPSEIVGLINNPQFNVSVSVVSVWEIIIKMQAGKLTLPSNINIPHLLQQSGLELLSVRIEHVMAIAVLPMYHRDPFDRLLIAQARIEHMTLISSDSKMKRYSLSLLSA